MGKIYGQPIAEGLTSSIEGVYGVNSKISAAHFQSFIFALACIVFSLILFEYHTDGDLVTYRELYDVVANKPIQQALEDYRMLNFSHEPGYFLFIYYLNDWFPKNLLMSIVNAAIGYIYFMWGKSKGVNSLVLSLALINFYAVVLFFPAERLKLALLPFLATLVLFRRGFLIGGGLAVITHIQNTFLLVSTAIPTLLKSLPALFKGKLRIRLVPIALLGVLCIITVILLFDYLLTKVFMVHELYGGLKIREIVKPLIFLGAATYYGYFSGKTIEAMAASVPMVVAAYFFGDFRINIFSYFIFMYYALQVNKGINIGVLVSSLYFCLKGLDFIHKIITLGNGFYGT